MSEVLLSGATALAAVVKKLSFREIDERVELLRGHESEADSIRAELKEQVQLYGFTPPRAEKSKRIETAATRLTLSTSTQVTQNDAVIEQIRACSSEDFFERIFEIQTKYKLRSGATTVLAEAKLPSGAPKSIRTMFSRAIEVKDKAPSLRIEELSPGA